MNFRTLAGAISALTFRSQLANRAGKTFAGKRDLYLALGYQREIQPQDYRSRYRRNEVANRIVKALPLATWRGFDLVEDEDPTTETAFEAAWADLNNRLKIESVFERADILAGIGRYSVILIGAPGKMDEPLEQCSADEIAYLTPYAEEDATIQEYDIDVTSPRFGLPIFYSIKRTSMMSPNAINSAAVGKRVHWTRVFHMADGLLDDNLFGEPRLECVWNRLDDLEKVAGGGPEAFWRRADPGIQFDLDPTLDFVDAVGSETGEKEKMREQVEKYEHRLSRTLFTRGLKINQLGSEVADFKSPVESLMSLISAGCGIPQRVLMGSEQGKLAAKQDRANWDNRVTDRQNRWAGPCVIKPFATRLIDLGALPEPAAGDFDPLFSSIDTMDDEQRAEIASKWAALNSQAGEPVVTPDEIREKILKLAPLAEANPDYVPPSPAPAPRVLLGKGGAPWKHVHQVADRFRGARKTYRQRLLQRSEAKRESQPAETAAEGQERAARLESHGYGGDRIRAELQG